MLIEKHNEYSDTELQILWLKTEDPFRNEVTRSYCSLPKKALFMEIHKTKIHLSAAYVGDQLLSQMPPEEMISCSTQGLLLVPTPYLNN